MGILCCEDTIYFLFHRKSRLGCTCLNSATHACQTVVGDVRERRSVINGGYRRPCRLWFHYGLYLSLFNIWRVFHINRV